MVSLRNFDTTKAADAFYGTLFALFPEIEREFTNAHSQKQMFEIALKTVIINRENHDELDKYIGLLGEQHMMMGIQRVHMFRGYQAFYAALEAGAPDLTDDDVDAFTAIYKRLLTKMGYDVEEYDFRPLAVPSADAMAS